MIVKIGNRGDAVKAIQEKLQLGVDGIFGSQTKAAVKNFQNSKGLQADGIVGPATAAALGIDLDESLTTDIQDRTLTTAEGLLIHKSYLDKDSILFNEKMDLDINGSKARSLKITQE